IYTNIRNWSNEPQHSYLNPFDAAHAEASSLETARPGRSVLLPQTTITFGLAPNCADSLSHVFSFSKDGLEQTSNINIAYANQLNDWNRISTNLYCLRIFVEFVSNLKIFSLACKVPEIDADVSRPQLD
ncbi:hypothetical protein BVRB_023280, partial [Beta vulgaris subsp. vulgaris]